MNYLENKLCKFTPLFNINYTKKINIISTCFFKLSGGGYKDFTKYVDGLKNLDKNILKKNLNYKIRLFIDDTIYSDKELYGMITKLVSIQPVLYSCPNFIIKDKHHIGLFGTLVRFFPFFDFPNNDANIVVSSDIDGTNLSIFNHIDKLGKNINLSNVYVMKSGELNRSLRYRFNFIYKNKLNPYVFAQSYASFKRIDHNVLVDYLELVNSERKNKGYSYHYSAYKYKEAQADETKYGDEHGSFIYGVDEDFLNRVLAEYLIDSKLCYVVRTSWDIFGPLYYVLEIEKALTDKEINLLNIIFEYVYKEIGFKLDKNMTISDKFNKLDEIVFVPNIGVSKNPELRYKILKVFYKMLLFLKSNPNYKFILPDGFYDLFINSKYFGIYNIDFFRIINCENKDRNIIISQEKFKKEDVEKFREFYQKYK